MSVHGSRQDKHKAHVKGALLLAILCVLAVAGYIIGQHLENADDRQERTVMSENFGRLRTREFKGRTYKRRPEVETLLILGVDKEMNDDRVGFRDGGQADFILLLAIDHTSREIRQFQIDRDTITDITVLGVLGDPAGTRQMQICLSHAFGGSPEESCRLAVDAVERYLGGEPIQMYMAVHLDAISVLNDTLGGVTVTIPEDYSHLDPAMVKGARLTLTDEQVELLVRSRRTVGDGTNYSRMQRQRVFLSAAVDTLKSRISKDADFTGKLFDALDRIASYTNIQRGRLINVANRAYNYNVRPVESPAGEYTIGSDGFVEFHADLDAVQMWVLDALYEPK